MMVANRSSWIFAALLTLAACGGGSSFEEDDGGGGGGGTPEPNPYTLSLSLVDVGGSTIADRNVSAARPGVLRATLRYDGDPVDNAVVTFAATAGEIFPTLGTALTDSSGVASVSLLPGTVAGAATATAIYQIPADGSGGDYTEVSTTFNFTTAGDGETDTGSGAQLLTVAMSSTRVSAAAPATVSATVLSSNGAPVVNRVVEFSTTLGRFIPENGTALTDASGVALIQLHAGTEQGAGEVTARFGGSSTSAGFYTEGDEVDESELTADVVVALFNCPEGVNPPSVSCVETNNISSVQPGTILVTASRSGSATPLADTLVNVSATIGKLSPSNGTALTNASGQAFLDLLAGQDVGAGEFIVTVAGRSVTKAFQIGAVDESDIVLEVSRRLAGSVPAGGSDVIDIDVFQGDGVTPYAESLQVEVTSDCVGNNTAEVDTPVVTINGSATSTYTAKGCVGTDPVRVTVITGGRAFSKTLNVAVDAAAVGSIRFVSTSEEALSIQQAGGLNLPTSAVVTFQLLDANSNPVAGREVEFSLSTGNGGVTVNPNRGSTNAQGMVSTTVTSGTVPTPVRVTASYSEAGTVVASNVSDRIIVSTGLADNNSVSLSVTNHNPEALSYDGEEVGVTAYAADHFNNPVPDGTVVYFTTEGGAIEPTCQTVNGRCSVTWRSQNPRPLVSGDPRFPIGFNFQNSLSYISSATGRADCTNAWLVAGPCLSGELATDRRNASPTSPVVPVGAMGGRSTITAYVLGEESFADKNNNGLYDPGEYFVPLGDVYVDHNENSAYDEDAAAAAVAAAGSNLNGGELEEFTDNPIPEAADGDYTPPAPRATAKYQGVLCSDDALAAGHCAVRAVHARASNTIVMSGSSAYFRVLNGSGVDTDTLDLRVTSSGSVALCIADAYNNPMPSGTRVSVTANQATLLSSGSWLIPDSTTTSPMCYGITAKRPDTPTSDGLITVTVTTPKGLISTAAIGVDNL